MAADVLSLRASELGERISDKSRCEVYRLGDGEVVKLFRREIPRSEIAHELRVTHALCAAGAPMPAVDRRLRATADGRLGIVTAHVAGESLSYRSAGIRRRPVFVRAMQDLRARIAALSPPEGLPSQRDWLRTRLLAPSTLSLQQRQRLLAALERLPREHQVCHGNLEPVNVIIRPDDSAVAIGWGAATLGTPMADVARSVVILSGPNGHGGALKQWSISLKSRRRASAYADAALGERTRAQEWRAWVAIQAAARLSEHLGVQQRKRLLALLARTDGTL